MKIDLDSIDRTQFDVTEYTVAGEQAFLVQPQRLGVNWTPDNLIYRSSLWNSRGEPMSLSWKKHHNWEESPEIDPAPTNLAGCELMEKVDGSTLLMSRYNDTMICRTRGTVDATKMENGDEIELFKSRYSKLFNPLNYDSKISPINNRCHITVVLEWVSPRNQIVVPYSEPDLYLTGIINHKDYSYESQDFLDKVATITGVKRPRRYSFNTIPEMLEVVKDFKGVEGICVYYNGGQSWRKCKAAEYLVLHRFKENVTMNNMMDLFFSYGRPDHVTFLSHIARDFDHECQKLARELVTIICEAHTHVCTDIVRVNEEVNSLRGLPRKEAAIAIQTIFDQLDRGVAFKCLDNRPIDDKMVRKLMEWMLDKSKEGISVAQ